MLKSLSFIGGRKELGLCQVPKQVFLFINLLKLHPINIILLLFCQFHPNELSNFELEGTLK
jgi:hypothetical protein